jgi:hypothetical protein
VISRDFRHPGDGAASALVEDAMHTALAYIPDVALAYMPDHDDVLDDDEEEAPPTLRSSVDLLAYARATEDSRLEEQTVIMPAAWLAQLRAQARGEVVSPKSTRIIEVVELCAEDVVVESEVANGNHAPPESGEVGPSSGIDVDIDIMVDEMFDAAMHA